ncbi:MAG: amidohydrolase family protein [Dehalococcoidia bacterium]
MEDIIIRADKFIDGRGGPIQQDMALAVKNGVISRVGPRDQLELPESGGPTVLEFPNATLLPGLIDCHTHTNMPANGRKGEEVIPDGDNLRLLRSARNAAAALQSGVTTMCDNGAWNRTGFALKEGISQGEVQGPNLLACGRPVTTTGGHLWFMGSEADGIDGVGQATRQLIKEGADFIKVMATGGSTLTSDPFRPAYSVEELKAIGDEGRRHNRMVAAHCRCNQGMQNVLEAGYDGIYHAFFAGEDGLPSFDQEIAKRIAEQGVWVNPTIHIGRSGIWALERKGEEVGLSEQEEAMLLERRHNHQVRLEHCSRMVDLGVKLIAGSDCGWGNYPFGQLAYELECMVMVGLSPTQAVSAATCDAAMALSIHDSVGTLEPGKQADLLLVGGDPSVNILDLMNVVAVFKAGVRV